MGFLHPIALLIGAAAAGLPVAVHLLTRPRPVRFPFSAMRFLTGALRQRRFFARLRDVLILAMRTLLVLAVAAAFARPLLQSTVERAGEGVARRVVVLDVSRSMNARRGGVCVFDRARAQAVRYLKRSTGLRMNLILAAARPQAVFDAFSANYPALEAEVRRAQVRDEELDARGALARAAQLLADEQEGKPGKGQVVIVTDLQETNWREVKGDELPADVEVLIDCVGVGPDAGNLAVTDVLPSGQAEAGGPVGVRVTVQNFSGADRLHTIRLTANERTYREEVKCPAWGSASVLVQLDGQDGAGREDGGWVTGTAHIVEARDALPADDERHFAFRVKEAPTYALITREDMRRVGTSSYFLSRMLCPVPAPSAGPGEHVVAVDAQSLGAAAAAEADLLVVNKPGRMEPEALEQLGGRLLHGGAVFYVVSETADAENLAGLGEVCRDALRLPVRFTAWAGRPAEEGLTLAQVQGASLPFRVFGDSLGRLTEGVTVSRILRTAPNPAGVQDEVLARWSDGSAALVDSHVGSGHLVIWNADLVPSSLPRSGFFVVLVRELAQLLLSDELAVDGALPVGTAGLLALPVQAESGSDLRVVGPGGQVIKDAGIEETGTGTTWRWATVGPPGVYRLRRGDTTVFAVAADCPGTESDLRPADADDLHQRFGPGPGAAGQTPRVTIVGLPGGTQRTSAAEVWPWLLVAALALMAIELCTLKLFRI